MTSDANAKRAIEERNKYRQEHNGKDDPALAANAASERAALMLEFKEADVTPPTWLQNG